MSRKLDEKRLDILYDELFKSQLTKNWRKADTLQRAIARIEGEAEVAEDQEDVRTR